MNILDISENSVKAGASLITVTLDYKDGDILLLNIGDDGKGMEEETAAKVENPFFTSRSTRKVGLGIPFMKMAAEMTGGSFEIVSELGKGTDVSAVFNTGHIDMVPLGDMGSTMSALISGNPDIDFIYSVRRRGNEFVLDSREIKQALGEVPVTAPQVAVFIREYVEENSRPVLS